MTYPEWHIVHAYEDYAQVIAKGDPHEFGYVSSIKGFWSSLCSLTTKAPAHGEIDGSTKSMVYTIGVSFTAELLLKAAYEETIGRLFASLRGDTRTPLDDLSAHQARAYAVDFVEIAGNDDILFTALSDKPVQVDAFFNFRRQGFSDYRHLVLLKVSDLAARLRTLYGSPLTLEHIHDY